MFVNAQFALIFNLHFPQLTSEDSYQIAILGVQSFRVEIVSDGSPPKDKLECALPLVFAPVLN